MMFQPTQIEYWYGCQPETNPKHCKKGFHLRSFAMIARPAAAASALVLKCITLPPLLLCKPPLAFGKTQPLPCLRGVRYGTTAPCKAY